MSTARYTVIGAWHDHDSTYFPFIVQAADLFDNRSKQTYRDGAMRVVFDGKPAVRGKGGTTPFKGETAWAFAESLARSLQVSERYVRTV
jgi:hypothetical protein